MQVAGRTRPVAASPAREFQEASSGKGDGFEIPGKRCIAWANREETGRDMHAKAHCRQRRKPVGLKHGDKREQSHVIRGSAGQSGRLAGHQRPWSSLPGRGGAGDELAAGPCCDPTRLKKGQDEEKEQKLKAK